MSKRLLMRGIPVVQVRTHISQFACWKALNRYHAILPFRHLRSVVLLLNNGVAHATSGSCVGTDFAKVEAVVVASSLNSTYTRRSLRAQEEDLDDMTESIMFGMQHRALSYPNKCKRLCAGVATGYCTAIDCKGYRRRNLLGEQEDRDLLSGAAFTCTQQENYINTELNKLVSRNNVSASCKTLISKPRNITCFDDVIYGVVEHFKLWDTVSSPQKVIIANYTGQDIARGQEITFEAITNECVNFLLTSLQGPNNFYRENGEYQRPFTVFQDTFQYDGKLFGLSLPHLGQYTLTALPDGLVEKKKVITFNVVPGTVTAVKLWDTVAKTVLQSNFTGGKVCNSKTVNFEAVMPYAESAKITLTSTNGFSHTSTEGTAPYTALGDNYGLLYGQKLSNGVYNLTIYPDDVVSNKVKTISFNVTSC